MLLLVVGLVVIVLVILVVVFLSVRSMRADEGDDHPVRPVGTGRAGTGRGDFDDGPRGYGDHDPDPGDQDRAPARRRGTPVPAARPGSAAPQRRIGSLPRPRGHQHDEDLDGRDWGGVSDEQYWAELSADKPLATTARSAQPGSDVRPGGRARSAEGAASAASGPAVSAEPWTDPTTTTGGPDTDPSIGGAAGWQDSASDGYPTAAWTAPGTDVPGTEDTRTWAAEDPLTSPSFSVPSAYRADSGSYPGSRDEGRPGFGEPAGVSDSTPYGGEDHYRPAQFWDSTSLGTAAASYGGGADDWRGPDHEYSAGALEPLPEPAGSAAEPSGSWYSAPTPTAETQSSSEAWDHGEVRYESGSVHDSYTGRGERTWQAPDPDYAAGTHDDQPAGYGAGRGHDSSGYDWSQAAYYQPDQASADAGYHRPDHASGSTSPLPAYGSAGTGYQLPDHGAGDPGYPPGHDSAGTGYQLPDHGAGHPGYPPGYDSAGTGYSTSGHDSRTGYQPSGYGSADADYARPAYGSGAPDSGFDQGHGYRHYPGYDGGRR